MRKGDVARARRPLHAAAPDQGRKVEHRLDPRRRGAETGGGVRDEVAPRAFQNVQSLEKESKRKYQPPMFSPFLLII